MHKHVVNQGHPKLQEIISTLHVSNIRPPAQALSDLRKVVADILTTTDYRRFYDFTNQVMPATSASDADVEFVVRFSPTQQGRDGAILKVGTFVIRVSDHGTDLGQFRAVPLSQD
jgi:hypothetical protein